MSIYRCIRINFINVWGSSSFIDQFLPDSLTDVDHADVSMDHADNLFTQLLEWLYLGKVPFYLVNYFLTVYSLTGLIIQDVFSI
jgi:hypothetical protein